MNTITHDHSYPCRPPFKTKTLLLKLRLMLVKSATPLAAKFNVAVKIGLQVIGGAIWLVMLFGLPWLLSALLPGVVPG